MTSACLQKLERGWARGMLDENAVAPNCCGPPKATQTARHLAPVQWDPLRGPHLALLISFASRFGLRLSGFARTAPGPQGWRQTTCGVVGACAHLSVRIQLFRFFGTKRMENNKIHMNPNRTRRWPRRESKRGFSLGLAVVDATINVFITINWRCFIRVLIAVSWGGLPQTPPAPLRVHLGLAAVLYASQSQ